MVFLIRNCKCCVYFSYVTTRSLIVLILTRRPGEQFYIFPEDIDENLTVRELFGGNQIVVEVIDTKGSQVRLGIDAPEKLTILRDDAKAR